MLFNSVVFLLGYLPVVVVGFYVLGTLGAHRAAAVWLGLASLFFYAVFDPLYLLPIILVSIGFNFWAGASLARNPRRSVLIFAITANLALLGYFKYAAFLIGTVAALFSIALPPPQIALPLGISFFTFTQIAYLADAYAGKAREYKPHHYLLFVTFFPHLVAGPILHHSEMMPQFQAPETYRLRLGTFALGLSWFVVGLFKKVVFADSLIAAVRAVFAPGQGGSLGFADAWLGTTAYALQIYFDFSGYSDMAIGLALLFGIRLPLNFNSPYRATSIIDFWRRWHITLSRFLRDYLYIPLGGNRKGRMRRYGNLMVTMLLGGLWHGASWNFVVWGGIHGVALAANHLWRALGIRMPKMIAVAVTFLIVVCAWVPFRANSLGDAVAIWSAMIDLSGPNALHSQRVDGLETITIAALLLIVWVLPNSQAILNQPGLFDGTEASAVRWRPNWRWAVTIGCAFGFVFARLMQGQSTAFIYFNF